MAAVNMKNNDKSQLTKLYEILRDMFQNQYYGSLEVKFEAGKVTIVKKTESIKI
ncbi:hypothetical protein LF845_01020 [Deferribacterales bacterium Es71-Z0220]|jgi:hypothetical protein|uniref:hypothetical protein n=1 Tax=Deferrivibrio essentukiensis TaxID=2880922 RepID=UPI001F611DCF|nr:hypothetical protein [Deferrivibrio essentukiensis]MBZ4642924.1 hypothetical protein [Deferribacteraceae bacterium]MCB4203535.1 hypothetical protein [Deferrivibrio essentukiensis]MDK2792557.1 hypothetical protein [Deferribacteres bacterium]